MINPYLMLFPSIDKEAYDEAKDMWLAQIEKHSGSAIVLRNAADFFRSHDKKLSKELSNKAQAIDPNASSLLDMFQQK